MKRFGLIGTPINHSKSPDLFKAAYGGRYTYNLIEASGFASSYKEFISRYDGINVTAPYKGEACASAQKLSHSCVVTGSANVLIKTEQGVEAWNTDIDGVRGCLQENFDIPVQEEGVRHKCGEGRTALIAGCGGAGKAAAFAALLENFNIILMNRNRLKAEVYARKLISMGKAPADQVTVCGLEDFNTWFRKTDCLIYTLPVRLPELDTLAEDNDSRLPQVIIEANYKDPVFSGSLAGKLADRQVRICPGEEWLLHQGVAAYRIFTGEEPDIEAMRKVL